VDGFRMYAIGIKRRIMEVMENTAFWLLLSAFWTYSLLKFNLFPLKNFSNS